jgi:hypothetical protein
MKWSLQSIGVPSVYWTRNPFTFSAQERLDSFPSLGVLDCVRNWTVQTGNAQALPYTAWQRYVSQYHSACTRANKIPFALDRGRRNHDEHVHAFLALRRKSVRDYVDPKGLVQLPFFRTNHVYTRMVNSWKLRSQGRVIKPVDGRSIAINLVNGYRWIRTHCPEYRGSQSWHRWIQYGTTRVGWSTSNTESWFWYEIYCPEFPGIDGNTRNLDDQAFTSHLDHIWIPLVKNLRWNSVSSPKTWNF